MYKSQRENMAFSIQEIFVWFTLSVYVNYFKVVFYSCLTSSQIWIFFNLKMYMNLSHFLNLCSSILRCISYCTLKSNYSQTIVYLFVYIINSIHSQLWMKKVSKNSIIFALTRITTPSVFFVSKRFWQSFKHNRHILMCQHPFGSCA